jgi:DNA-binding response OmpR family regulator
MELCKTLKKIFIIDDDKFLLDMYTVKFVEQGFDVTQAFGSIDALTKLKEGNIPHLLLLDVVMPTMDGFELLSTIKNENLAPNTKIIMLSNLGQHSDIERGRNLGANGYIIKASATPTEIVEKAGIVLCGKDLFANVE